MSWLIGFSLLAIMVVTGLVVRRNRWRFAAQVARELRALLAIRPSGKSLPAPQGLPAIVERYRRLAVGDRAPVRRVRLRHGGTFRTSPSAKFRPIRGVQWFSTDPPGFVWWGRVRIAPGLWIDARDMLAAGAGSMRVLIDDTVSLADAHGSQLDQGGALRLLAELVWVPTALFDARWVTWDAVDASHARATLRLGELVVHAIFELGPDGLPVRLTAERFNDRGECRPWGGVYRDWRTVAGMRVPFEVEVSWQLAAPYSYAHWRIDSIAYDAEVTAEIGHLVPATAAPRLGGLAKASIALELVLGIGAIGGGLALMFGPHGEIIPLPLAPLAGSPFATYFIPGAILFAVLGIGPVVAAVLAHRRDPWAPFLALAVGAGLVIWITVEIAIVGYSNEPPLQALYLGLGVVIAMVGRAWIRASPRHPATCAGGSSR
ncbi:MAG: DUF6544 family protein [Kofleriaceae bacterium]